MLESAPQTAAANWLLALQAIVSVATALGKDSEAARYQSVYNTSAIIYDARFWNSTTKSWTHDRDQLQTVSSISLGAGIGPARRAEAVAALHKDVASRQYHLTVGSVGAKWLLRTLSEEGKHDTALRVAL